MSGTDNERLDQLSRLLEEVADDNTAVVASISRLSQGQELLGAEVVREISALRGELAGTLAFRALKDLCTELIGPLAAMEAMLKLPDLPAAGVMASHVQSLALTLRSVLNRMGAAKIPVEPGRDMFDPNVHRCAAVVATACSPFPSAAPHTVVRVLEDGYLLDNRLLTPAVVEIQAGATHE